jgi:hypothetical protein
MDVDPKSQRHGPPSSAQLSGDRSVAHAGGLSCRCADNKTSFLAAFRLIYDAYLRSGLGRPNRFGLRFLPHHLLKTSSVLLAARREFDVGTLSIVEDGELGLPIDVLCPLEIAKLRRGGSRIAELSCLAVGATEHNLRWSILRVLLRGALQLTASGRIDFLTVCVHPRHARFYQDRLGFARLGPPRRCPWVCDRPAIALYRGAHDMNAADTLIHEVDPLLIPLQNATRDSHRYDGRESFRPLLKEASPFPWPARRFAAA